MLLSSASVLLSTHLIKLIMGVYHSTEFVGIFNATLNVVLIQNFIQAATNSIAGPKLAEVNRLENRKELGVIARHTTNINTYLTIPVTLFLLLFNKPLLSILGKEFIVGSDAFLIMLLGNFITVLCGPTSVFMNMTGLQKVLRNIIMLSLVISSIVAFVFIPKYGIIGGAISYSVFIVSWNIICSVYVKIKTGINLFFWPFKLNN
ncbi:MAG: hypothetical protein KJO64_02145, partial [Bacteroidia bacterium]|nr:hypothetical protein [Bacteroidia bacterium]